MAKSLTISTTSKEFPEQLEFQQLRELGIKHISNLSGKIWTDHNLHDPGITILEVLTYALTDLVYRQNLSIEDLLATENKLETDNNFFTPAEILTCNPVTIEDYRKMLIDIDGVRNAWLEIANENETDILVRCPNEEDALPGGNLAAPLRSEIQQNICKDENEDSSIARKEKAYKRLILNGLYKVYLELESIRPQDKMIDACGEEQIPTDRILREVNERLHQHRNLSEDFLEVLVLEEEQIGLCADLELAPNADPEEVLVDLFKNVQIFLSPFLNFYTLEELLEKGKTPEEAFAGRPYITDNKNIISHGFVDVEELKELERKTGIHVSDLYRVILQDERIRAIKSLYVLNYREGVPLSKGEEWCLKLSEGHRPILSPELSRIKFFKGVIPFTVDIKNVKERYEEKLANFAKVKLSNDELNFSIPEGEYRNDLGNYYSIQRDFPQTYMVGEKEVPASATALRKAQAKQLKGYLMFFDQLLADYLTQLTHVRDLFSFQQDTNGSTFFPKKLKEEVPHIEEVIQYFEENESDQKAIAKNPNPFNTPSKRDEELRKTIREIQKGDGGIEAEKRDCGYVFLIKNKSENILLESVELFGSEQEAKSEAAAIIILAGEKQSYRTLNFPTRGEYGFEFFYNPIRYCDLIKSISEDSEKYYQRKNQFLDHLLGRFSEQFTDYILLMYAMNGKQHEPEKIIQDKTEFLSCYPKISRNRGKAFNYSDGRKIWDTDNISGLEEKVAKLLGIPNPKRAYLNNFKIVERKTKYHFQYSDHRGQELVVSEMGFDTKREAFDKGQLFLDYLSNSENEVKGTPIDCLTEQVFSFKIKNENSILNVIHPYDYSGDYFDKTEYLIKGQANQVLSKIRDSKQSFTINLLAGKGIVPNFKSLEQGFYFFLFNDVEQVQMISSKSYFDENLVWQDWFRFIELAINKDNYRNTSDPLKNEFGFEVGFEKDGTFFPLGKNPFAFKSKSARTTARNKLIAYLQEKQLKFQIPQAEPTFFYEIQNKKGVVVLQAKPRFKTQMQTTAAYYYLMKIAADEAHYFPITKLIDGEPKYSFIIGERGTYEEQLPDGSTEAKDWQVDLAESPLNFDTDKEREEGMLMLQNQIKKQQSFSEIVFTDHSAWSFELMNDEGESWMQSVSIFSDRRNANKAWERFITLARKKENYQLIEEEGFLKRGIEIIDKGKTIAVLSKEPFPNAKEANAFIDEIIAFVKSGKAVFADRYSEAFYFKITHPKTDRTIRSGQLYRTKVEALLGYDQLMKAGSVSTNYHLVGNKKDAFSFEIKNEDGILLGESEKYMYRGERDDAIQDFCKYIVDGASFFSLIQEDGDFGIQVLDNNNEVALEGVQNFETQLQAQMAVWNLAKKATDLNNYNDLNAEDGCQFSFEIKEVDDENSLALHPKYYLSETNRDEAAESLKDYIEKNCFQYDILRKQGTWCFEILWENCEGVCEVLLKNDEEYDFDFEAEHAYRDFWSEMEVLLEEEELSKVFHLEKIENAYTFFVQPSDGNQFVLRHPNNYSDEATALAVIEDAIAYFLCAIKQHQSNDEAIELETSTDEIADGETVANEKTKCGLDVIENNRTVGDEVFKTAPTEGKNISCGFRLNAGKEPIAVHPHRYNTKEERDAIANVLLQALDFSKMEMNGIVKKAKERFYFNIVENADVAKILWRSATGFSTRKAAKGDFEISYLEIIEYSKSKSAYQITAQEEGYRLELLNKEGEMIAFYPTCFLKKSEAQLAGQYRRQWATIFPIIKKGKYYGFQIFNAKTQKVDWQSKRLFENEAEAMKAFVEFLALHPYQGNLQKVNIEDACIFGIEMREVLLESERDFDSYQEAWSGEGARQCYGLNDVLRAIQEENGVYPYFDPHQNCRFSFNVVHPTYRLLRHTKNYLTPDDREKTRDELFTKFQCGAIECSEVEFYHVCIMMEYFGLLKNLDTQQEIWRGSTGFSSDEEAKADIQKQYFSILQNSREYDYYVSYQEEGGIRLKLIDDKNNIIAVSTQLYSDDEQVRAAIAERMLFARQFPFTITEDVVVIELYCKSSEVIVPETEEEAKQYCPPEELEVEVLGEVVWKSTKVYDSIEQANCDLPIIKEVLKTKSNYQRPDTEDCGPFTIEITNPKRVLAFHPRAYTNRTDMEAGKKRMLGFVNREGFHLVEHILLRPRASSEENVNKLLSKIPLCLEQELCDCAEWEIPVNEQAIMDNYLPGADPFSFWVSIVIPFWPKRFQSQNFRAFFEDTLRRELPAHIAMRICWVAPEKLFEFEDKYKNWLSALSGSAACNFQEAQCEVLEQLFSMRNVYDPASLHGCDIELTTSDVYLNQTKLG